MVKIDEVKRDRRKKIVMSIRTTEEISEFMKEHDISPSRVFEKAVEELRDKENGKDENESGASEELMGENGS